MSAQIADRKDIFKHETSSEPSIQRGKLIYIITSNKPYAMNYTARNGPRQPGTRSEIKSPPTRKRDKKQTIDAFLRAGEKVLREEGIHALKVHKVERESGYSKRMMYTYFSDLDTLLEQVLYRNDPWLRYDQDREEMSEAHQGDSGRQLGAILLRNHFKKCLEDRLVREINLFELNGSSKEISRRLCEAREKFGEEFFKISKEHFSNQGNRF